MAEDATNVREDGADGAAAGAAGTAVRPEPVNDDDAAEADAPDEGEEDDNASALENGPVEDTDAIADVEVAEYRITGLVDYFDEQNNIQGQFPVGSVQELPVEYGDRMVEEGQAEAVNDDDGE